MTEENGSQQRAPGGSAEHLCDGSREHRSSSEFRQGPLEPESILSSSNAPVLPVSSLCPQGTATRRAPRTLGPRPPLKLGPHTFLTATLQGAFSEVPGGA